MKLDRNHEDGENHGTSYEEARIKAFRRLERGDDIKDVIVAFASEVDRLPQEFGQGNRVAGLAMVVCMDPELTYGKALYFINGWNFYKDDKEGWCNVPLSLTRSQRFERDEQSRVLAATRAAAEPSKEERLANTESYIEKFILHNPGLTYEAKEFLVDMARSNDWGFWSQKDWVTDVSQTGTKVTITHKSGFSSFEILKPDRK